MQSIMLALLTLKARFEEQKEKGATAVEYALIIALVSIAIITALALLVPPVRDAINGVIEQLEA